MMLRQLLNGLAKRTQHSSQHVAVYEPQASRALGRRQKSVWRTLSGIGIGVVELQLFHWGYFLRMVKEQAKEGKLVSGSKEDSRRVSLLILLILCKNYW